MSFDCFNVHVVYNQQTPNKHAEMNQITRERCSAVVNTESG